MEGQVYLGLKLLIGMKLLIIVWRTYQRNRETAGWNTIPLASNLSSRRSATGASTGKENTGSQHLLKDYLKRRNLILALIRREIERLSTWHNPMALPELNFSGLESLVNWANQNRVYREDLERAGKACLAHFSRYCCISTSKVRTREGSCLSSNT